MYYCFTAVQIDLLTSDIQRDRGANGGIFSQLTGERGTIVFVNRFNTHAAVTLLISFLQLDSGTVSQPHQLLIGFVTDILLAHQRHDVIEFNLYNTVAVDTKVSLDLDTLRREGKKRKLNIRSKSESTLG